MSTLAIRYDGANFYVLSTDGTGTTVYGPYASRALAEAQVAALTPVATAIPDEDIGASLTTGFVEFSEVPGDVAHAAADDIRLYAKDNGSGVTHLYQRRSSGLPKRILNEDDGFSGDFGSSIVPTFTEQGSDPAAPSANVVKLYAKDDGDGATKLFLRNTTDVQEVATIDSSGNIQPTAQDTAATAGKARGLIAGAGNTTGTGGSLTLTGGTGGSDANGGALTAKAGNAGGGNRIGGQGVFGGGNGTGTQRGGHAFLQGGNGGSSNGTGGRANLVGGAGGGAAGVGGGVIIQGGFGSGGNGSTEIADASGNPVVVVGATNNTLGFYGATPTTKPTNVANPAGGAVIDAESRTAIDAILSRLETLGLFAA